MKKNCKTIHNTNPMHDRSDSSGKDRVIKHLNGQISSLRHEHEQLSEELERKENELKKLHNKAENKIKKLKEEVLTIMNSP